MARYASAAAASTHAMPTSPYNRPYTAYQMPRSASKWMTLMPSCECRHKWRAYSSSNSTKNSDMGRLVSVVMFGPPRSERIEEIADGGRQQLIERPAQHCADRRAHVPNLRGIDRQRRRDFQDVGLVLAEADQHRITRMFEHGGEVEPEQALLDPAARPARGVELDTDEQPVNTHRAHDLAIGQLVREEAFEQRARLGDAPGQLRLL